MSDKLLKGTFILTLGTYISRLLGIIYMIPFVDMVDTEGSALYQMGYTPYVIFLSIATAGFPMAVSKFVSRYNSMGDYQTSLRMFRNGMFVMLLMGLLSFGAMYYLAPDIAAASLDSNDAPAGKVEDVTYIIRMLSVALIIVPIMALIRGFFQGHQMMGPTSVSQVVEQLVRIIFLLVSVYTVLYIQHGSLVTAIGFATIAAAAGAAGGLIVLYIYWLKRRDTLEAMKENTVQPSDVKMRVLFKELLTYSIPFVFVGLAIPLYQVIDQKTMYGALRQAGVSHKEAFDIFAYVQFQGRSLIMILVSLATAFGLTLVPSITKAFTAGDMRQVHKQTNQAFQIIMFLILPATAGMMVLAGPIYEVFFGYEPKAAVLLQWQAPAALLFCYFTVNAAILQGINKQKLAVISLAAGLIVKAAVNYPLVVLFGGEGSIMATALGFAVSILYGFAMIKRHAGFSFKMFFKRAVFIFILTIVMSIFVSVLESITSIFIGFKAGKVEAAIVLVISIGGGAAAYLYAAHKSHLLEKLLGSRFSFLNRKTKGKA
ncbi:polysaccharide biosynthesis protein [Bacillus sp. FJAT-42376]|uniref:putative polysaccharide biosynthesis protein n=1 Tax=Bacillus sp. FJAT-42376 TaxID=2014076 RepID=UPI000F502AA2|nr:polysaccharide biosynthesis protein [Bacillus sp. FJAT-42376]AZB44025.1 polysaccharide biosynthesis protein [Bacillus sp. FJAT-42376]